MHSDRCADDGDVASWTKYVPARQEIKFGGPNYNPDDEVWEFPPHSIVRAQVRRRSDGSEFLLAIKP